MQPILVASSICSAFHLHGVIGTKVTDALGFRRAVDRVLQEFDFQVQRVPGQAVIEVQEVIPFVSAGVGARSSDPSHYILREHRGNVSAYLKREFAASVKGCGVVIYTQAAYLNDPDITQEETARIEGSGATHVVVAVLASAGRESPLSPYRFVWNLSGGNREAELWTADEIRAKAKEIMGYDTKWSTVADP